MLEVESGRQGEFGRWAWVGSLLWHFLVVACYSWLPVGLDQKQLEGASPTVQSLPGISEGLGFACWEVTDQREI